MVRKNMHIIMPDEQEDAAITAAAKTDVDNLPLNDAQLANMAPVKNVRPQLAVKHRRRGRPEGSNKEQVTLRLDKGILEAAGKGRRKGWQTEINEVLRQVYIKEPAFKDLFGLAAVNDRLASVLIGFSEAVAAAINREHLTDDRKSVKYIATEKEPKGIASLNEEMSEFFRKAAFVKDTDEKR